MEFQSKQKVLLEIFLRSFRAFFYIGFGAYLLYVVKQYAELELIYFFFFLIYVSLLHKTMNRSTIAFIEFNLIKKAVLERTDTYVELSKRERLQNTFSLLPLSVLIVIGILGVKILLVKLLIMLIVLCFLLIGETAKYRLHLYKTWYDQHLHVN